MNAYSRTILVMLIAVLAGCNDSSTSSGPDDLEIKPEPAVNNYAVMATGLTTYCNGIGEVLPGIET